MFKYPLIIPYINEEVKDKVLEVLDSGYLTEGSYARELEGLIASYTGCSHAITVSSNTTGLECALRAAGIGPGDEVIIPDYTHPATAAVVAIVGATGVFVDIDIETLLVDYNELEKAITDKTKAIIPVSQFGNPLDYHRLNDLKEKYDLVIIEDAACSIGAEFENKKVGNIADISVFSFHPRKFITTGEGGMVVTNNDSYADYIRSYKNFGLSTANSRVNSTFTMIGTNYKMSNIQAAVGIVQLKMIDELLHDRVTAAQRYIDLLKSKKNIDLQIVLEKGKHSYQSFPIRIKNRDEVLSVLRENGIEVQIGTYALSTHKAFSDTDQFRKYGNLENSQEAFNTNLVLPLYYGIAEEDQIFIVDALVKDLER